jgi:hypothetical protein
VCRLNFNGVDDELIDVDSGYYNTKLKRINNHEINTKLLRFRIDNLCDVKLSQNAKIILESVYLPSVLDNDLDCKHYDNIILRFKNISDSKSYDSSYGNNCAPILFSHSFQARTNPVVVQEESNTAAAVTTHIHSIVNYYSNDLGVSFHNPSPDKLYNFTIPNTFTNNTVFEFEIIYNMKNGIDITIADDEIDFYRFQCSLIICDVDEEELTSKDSNTVDLDKFKPHFPLKRSL